MLEGRGFRRGFVQGWQAPNGELLGITVIELGSPDQARSSEGELGVCIAPLAVTPFEVPSVSGATGWRCIDRNGLPVQEVVFTRGPRTYKVKLERARQPESATEIAALAQAEAAVAR